MSWIKFGGHTIKRSPPFDISYLFVNDNLVYCIVCGP